MRAIQFRITLCTLVMKDWDEWKREDQNFIEKCAKQNNISSKYDMGEVTYTGSQKDLFFFLHDLAYRYDIEII